VSGPPAVGGVTGASRPPVCRSLSAARHRAVVKDPPERSLTPWRGASRFPKWQVLYGRLWRTRAARSAISGRAVRLMSLGTCLGVFVCRGIGAGFLVFVMCVHRETQSFGSTYHIRPKRNTAWSSPQARSWRGVHLVVASRLKPLSGFDSVPNMTSAMGDALDMTSMFKPSPWYLIDPRTSRCGGMLHCDLHAPSVCYASDLFDCTL
jgi:hypothetical protein